jgi:pyruvate-ferredoxin/flavodoxin oxidoreductase
VFYLDAFQIAREEAGAAELQLRMQGIAFQGAFFAASPTMSNAGLTEDALFTAIEAQLQAKFGGKGARVVADNLRVVRRGFTELTEITEKEVGVTRKGAVRKDVGLPVMLRQLPAPEGTQQGKVGDIHRFWEQTGNFYLTGKGNDNIVDPFIGASLVPAATGVFRDMTGIRFEHPEWIAENCTACGNCYVECPDSAIPGLVSSVGDVLNTAINRIETGGMPTRYLRRAARSIEKKLRTLVDNEGGYVRPLFDRAMDAVLAETPEAERSGLAAEFTQLQIHLGGFQFSATKPYWGNREKKQKGSGGLFSITVNPYTCKGCALCVTVCEDNALKMVTQTEDSVERLRRDWNTWLELPTTPKDYSRIDSLDEKIGALETLLLDKKQLRLDELRRRRLPRLRREDRDPFVHLDGDGADAAARRGLRRAHRRPDPAPGTAHARQAGLGGGPDRCQGRGARRRIDRPARPDLVQPGQQAECRQALATARPGLGEEHRAVAGKAEGPQVALRRGPEPARPRRDGHRQFHRLHFGVGLDLSLPPLSLPVDLAPLFQDSPSVAMGIFEGHMAKMADGFKAVRMAEKELAGDYLPDRDEDFFRRFTWQQFSADEWQLCPPVVSIGGDGAMYDIGFQNLSRALMSGMPIKILVVDTQVYSNTGGQACTSGFISQVSDMAPWGDAQRGKQEVRKEISLIGMAHRTSYVMSGTIAHVNHLIESYIDGLNSRRPALFNIYAVCPPEHGVGDDRSVDQSKLAVEGRAYPLFRFDPDAGTTFAECVSLEGNPSPDTDWPTYTLKYVDEAGAQQSMDAADDLRRFRGDRGALPQAFPQGAARDLERVHGAGGRVPRTRS